MSMPRHRDTCHTTLPLCVMLLALLASFGAGCDSNRDQPDQVAEETRQTDPAPPATAPEAAEAPEAITAPSTETKFSDAPKCNALVTRIAAEMVPCLMRVKPEMGEQLQTMIDNFRTTPPMFVDLVNRDEELRQTEEDCHSYWRSIVNKPNSKSPEGQCRLDLGD